MKLNRLLNQKKGIHGIGILIIFLALIIISVTASALVLHSANSLAQEGGESYDAVKDNARIFQIVEVAGFDGRDQQLGLLTVDAKLLTNSPPIDMRRLSLSIGEKHFRTILKYRAYGAPIENSNEGYNTWAPQEFGELEYTQASLDLSSDSIENNIAYVLPLDVDGDGSATDSVIICDGDGPCPSAYEGTHLRISLSGETDPVYVELRNQDGSLVNLSSGGQTLDVLRGEITGDWGYITLSGVTIFPYDIDDNTAVTLYTKGYAIDADLDDDGQDDYLGLNATHFTIDLSNGTSILSYPLGADISSTTALDTEQKIIVDGEIYGTVTIQGTTTQVDVIDADVTFTLAPYHLGAGYYVTKHLIRAGSSRNGYMLPGDVVRFYIEAYQNISTDDILSVRIMYHDLESTSKRVYVGNTFPNKEKVLLYPKP